MRVVTMLGAVVGTRIRVVLALLGCSALIVSGVLVFSASNQSEDSDGRTVCPKMPISNAIAVNFDGLWINSDGYRTTTLRVTTERGLSEGKKIPATVEQTVAHCTGDWQTTHQAYWAHNRFLVLPAKDGEPAQRLRVDRMLRTTVLVPHADYERFRKLRQQLSESPRHARGDIEQQLRRIVFERSE